MAQLKLCPSEGRTLPLTIDFQQTIRERAQEDEAFRQGLREEAAELMLLGDFRMGQKLLSYVELPSGTEDPKSFSD